MSSQETFQYYNQHADLFIEGTVHSDMSPTRERFLAYLPASAHILDAGCGSGRDSLAFLQAGHQVTAIDGSEELCRKATELIGQPVRHQYFEAIDESEVYDGIWACATLLHVPSTGIKQVLKNMISALKEGGYFYVSFKYGEFEGMRNGRYFTDYTEASIETLLSEFQDISIVEQWQTKDVRPDREEYWINMILQKTLS